MGGRLGTRREFNQVASHGDTQMFVEIPIGHIQLFQLTSSDQSLKPTRKDRMVVWVKVQGCCTCRILMRCDAFVRFLFLSLQTCENK